MYGVLVVLTHCTHLQAGEALLVGENKCVIDIFDCLEWVSLRRDVGSAQRGHFVYQVLVLCEPALACGPFPHFLVLLTALFALSFADLA